MMLLNKERITPLPRNQGDELNGAGRQDSRLDQVKITGNVTFVQPGGNRRLTVVTLLQ